jgi:hypothetical protein
MMQFLYLQEAMNTHNEPVTSSYGGMDTGLRYSYSQLGSTSYPSSAFSSQSYGGYGSSSLGGYSSFRLWRGWWNARGLISFQLIPIREDFIPNVVCVKSPNVYALNYLIQSAIIWIIWNSYSRCNVIVVIFFMFLRLIFCILYKKKTNKQTNTTSRGTRRERLISPGSTSCFSRGDQFVLPHVNISLLLA